MQPLKEGTILLCAHDYIYRASGRIDDGRSGYTHFRDQIAAIEIVVAGDSGNTHSGVDKADLPQWRNICAVSVICIEGENCVVFSCDENHVVNASARDIYLR